MYIEENEYYTVKDETDETIGITFSIRERS